MELSYTFNPYAVPGAVVVVVENHQTYTAESFAQAQAFTDRLLSDAPILLPAPSEAEALLARVLAREIVPVP